jgi:hypothetical protein
MHCRGFLTVDLLIAIMVFSLAITGIVLVASEGQTAGLDVGLDGGGVASAFSELQRSAQESAALAGFTALISNTDTSGFYDKIRTVGSISPCLKALQYETAWDSEHNRSLGATFSTFVASIAIAKQFGGGCDPIPPSLWDNPDSLESVDIGGAPGTGIAVRSIDGDRYVFVTANPSAAAGDDFYVYEVNDPASAGEVASLNDGAGMNEIAMGDEVAFVLEDANTGQLKVVNVSDPTTPSVVTSVSLPNVVFTCSPPSSTCMSGRSIAYFDDMVYIGTGYLAFGASHQNHEFHIFDVSNPNSPSWKGSVNINHNVNDIVVDGEHAYLATSDDAGELTVVDISDPTAPVVEARYNASWSTRDAHSIAKQGNLVLLGRERAASGDYDFLTFDVSAPASPSLLGRLRLSMNGANSAVAAIVVQGDYAFIGTSDTNDEFRVLDISDPSSPTPYGCPPYNYSARVADLAYADNYLFAANTSNDAVRIIYDADDATCN